MLKIFNRDVLTFAHYFFPHHCSKESPSFHREVLGLYSEEENDKVAIAAPRGFSKSTITSLFYLVWRMVFKKSHFIILCSDTFTQAVMFLEAVKSEIEGNERLQAFFPLKIKRWSNDEIIVNDVMVKAVGAGASLRGLKFKQWRPDLFIGDDLEDDDTVINQARRDKQARWFANVIQPILADKGKIIVIGTILHYDSLLNNLLNKEKFPSWTTRLYKAVMDNKPLWEERMSLAQAEALKEEYTKQGRLSSFYQEYMNEPLSGEDRKFKMDNAVYYEEEQLVGKKLNHFIMVDRAYSLEKTSDFTGIIVVGVDLDNNWYVRLAKRFKGLEKDLINELFGLRQYYNVTKIGIEQKAFKSTIEPNLIEAMRTRNEFFKCEELKDNGLTKEYRIEGLLPRFETGTLFLKRDQKDLIEEMFMFPRGQYDDLLDALSYGLRFCVPPNNVVQLGSGGEVKKSYI